MAVDSVSGSSSDSTEAARIRRLQEERTAALKKTEERSQKEIQRLNESRDQQLEAINEAHVKEIEEKRQEAKDRLDLAKSDADNRLRNFEFESQKLSAEATRQLQAKAQAMQRTTEQMEHQRELLHKHHEDALQRLTDANAEREATAIRQGLHEAAVEHMNQARALNEINERGEAEQVRLRDDYEEAKRLAVDEGAHKLRKIQTDYMDSTNQIERAINFGKREGEEQLAKDRQNIMNEDTRLSIEAQERGERLERATEHALAKMHYEGNRKLAEAQNSYGKQVSAAEHEAKKKILDQANKYNYTMRSMQAEAEAQEQLARMGYANQKNAIGQARNKAIADAIAANESLQEKIRADYQTRAHADVEATEQKLNAQFATDDAELKYHREEGRRAVNAQIMKDAQQVSSRASKAADPFYRVQSMGAHVDDNELMTVVRLAVPEHEQDSIRLSLQKNSITISGTRRFQDHMKTPEGHEMATSAYQSYSESFPVRGKLVVENMTRDYADGVLTFRIPKG